MNTFEEFCQKIEFPKEAIAHLLTCRDKMLAAAGAADDLSRAKEMLFYYETDAEYLEILQSISERSGVHRYSVDMVFYVMSALPLYHRYLRHGYSEEQYWENMMDLRCKLHECHDVYGIWGTFVSWFAYFYRLKRFKLGRLQYEEIAFPEADYHGILKAGDTVLNCHIPSCGPLKPEDVMDSLKQAYAFYRAHHKNGLLPVICSSWLLYPIHGEMFTPGSNLRSFYEIFDIVSQKERPNEKDFWRIFNQPYDPATLASAPEDTRLRRVLKEYLLAGNSMGQAVGVLLFDGERLVRPE